MTTTKTKKGDLVATLYAETEPEALRKAIELNLRGWDTTRISKLGDRSYVVQMLLTWREKGGAA